MMKTTLRVLVCTAVFALLTSVAQAQEVFNYVLASATRTVNNPSQLHANTDCPIQENSFDLSAKEGI